MLVADDGVRLSGLDDTALAGSCDASAHGDDVSPLFPGGSFEPGGDRGHQLLVDVALKRWWASSAAVLPGGVWRDGRVVDGGWRAVVTTTAGSTAVQVRVQLAEGSAADADAAATSAAALGDAWWPTSSTPTPPRWRAADRRRATRRLPGRVVRV